MYEFVLFVKCWFRLVDWQAFFNAHVFKFTAVTPLESVAAWLLARCRSDVFFYSIMEAALSRANIVVCTVAGIFGNNIVWLVFLRSTVSGTIVGGLFRQKGSNIVHSACNENLLVRFLDDGFHSSVDGVVDLEENLIVWNILSGGVLSINSWIDEFICVSSIRKSGQEIHMTLPFVRLF